MSDMTKYKKIDANAAAASDDLIQQSLNRAAQNKERFSTLLPYAGIVLLVLLFAILTKGKFISLENLKLLLNQCFVMVIIMIGATFIYAHGSMDMAIGNILALSSLVLALLYNANVPFVISLLAAIVTSVGFMCITATAKNYLGLNPFIASLCVANIASGIVVARCKVSKVTFAHSKAPWLNEVWLKLVVLVALIIIGYMVFNYTAFGKSLKSIGGNLTVARISGIKVEKTTYLAYIALGIAVGIAALFTVSRVGAVDPSIGSSMNLNVMIAIVLGGFPLAGGANSRFSAPIIGSLMVTTLTNGLAMMGQANFLGYGIKGLLFIIVVAITYEKSKGKLIN